MVRLYLWDAPTAGTLGVADSQHRAAAAAAACLTDGGTARVEAAWLAPGDIARPGYRRTGICWTGRLSSGQVVWTSSEVRAA
jgi:hypothetical protein